MVALDVFGKLMLSTQFHCLLINSFWVMTLSTFRCHDTYNFTSCSQTVIEVFLVKFSLSDHIFRAGANFHIFHQKYGYGRLTELISSGLNYPSYYTRARSAFWICKHPRIKVKDLDPNYFILVLWLDNDKLWHTDWSVNGKRVWQNQYENVWYNHSFSVTNCYFNMICYKTVPYLAYIWRSFVAKNYNLGMLPIQNNYSEITFRNVSSSISFLSIASVQFFQKRVEST